MQDLTVSQAFEKYRQNVVLFEGLAKRTEEQYEITGRTLAESSGDVLITDLNFDHVREWKFGLDKTKSKNTVSAYLTALRMVLKYFSKLGMPVLDYELVRVPKRVKKVPRFLTADEVYEFSELFESKMYKAIVILLFTSGMRISELCALDRDDFGRTFTIRNSKNNESRLSKMNEDAYQLVLTYLKGRRDSNPALFYTRQGSRVTAGSIQKSFQYQSAKYGKRVNPHILRDSFATHCVMNGMDFRTLQSFLGHKNINTTMIYTHLTDPYREAQYDEVWA